jgi:hypothetical protein
MRKVSVPFRSRYQRTGGYCNVRSFMICPPHISGGRIKKHEFGRKFATYEVEYRCVGGSGDHPEELGVNGN